MKQQIIKKLKKSDYTKEELKEFPDAPYWDEVENEIDLNKVLDEVIE